MPPSVINAILRVSAEVNACQTENTYGQLSHLLKISIGLHMVMFASPKCLQVFLAHCQSDVHFTINELDAPLPHPSVYMPVGI